MLHIALHLPAKTLLFVFAMMKVSLSTNHVVRIIQLQGSIDDDSDHLTTTFELHVRLWPGLVGPAFELVMIH